MKLRMVSARGSSSVHLRSQRLLESERHRFLECFYSPSDAAMMLRWISFVPE